jgi:hypothetical protein
LPHAEPPFEDREPRFMTLRDELSNEAWEALLALFRASLAESHVPEHLRDGLVRYVTNGILPGGFMQAVLCNNLREAMRRGSYGGVVALPALVDFLTWHMPPEAWGSVARVLGWTSTPERLEIDVIP